MLNRNLFFIFFFQPILSLTQTRIDSQSGTVCEIIVALDMEARFLLVRLKKIIDIPSWINVMDPDFNLHLKTAAVSSAWLVKKPRVDGLIHSLEIFVSSGEMIVQFFGKRKPGLPEAANWWNGILQLAEQFIN